MKPKGARDKNYEFALAFLKEAKEDLEVAEELLDKKRYSRAVFHCQQCCEKAIKSALEMEKVFVEPHDISRVYLKFIYNNPKYSQYLNQLNEILEILNYFDEEWEKTRYPKEENGKVIAPKERYTKEDALEAFNKAEVVFNIIKNLLKEEFKLK